MAEPGFSLWKMISGISIVVAGAFCFLMTADAKQDKVIMCKLETKHFMEYKYAEDKKNEKFERQLEKISDKQEESNLKIERIITILEGMKK